MSSVLIGCPVLTFILKAVLITVSEWGIAAMMCANARAPRGNPQRHGKNMQTPHRENSCCLARESNPGPSCFLYL